MEVIVVGDEAEVEGETVVADEAGSGSVSIPIVHILGEVLTVQA